MKYKGTMTAINVATDIPSQINTLEQLVAWGLLALSAINPNEVAVEGVGYSERAAQSGVYYVAADEKHRMLGRASIQFDAAYLSGGQKTWKYAIEMSTAPMPSAFKAN